MHRALKIIRDYSGLLALLLVAGGLAVAATGDPLKLGQSNRANRPTAVQNTGTGPVLDLKAKAGQPPLKVNSDAKVRNLNADKVDGRDVSALALAAAVYTKSQADARFAAAGAAYTKAQADSRFGQILYRKTFSGTTPNGGAFGQILDSFDLAIPGPGMVVAMLQQHPGSAGVQVSWYVGDPAAFFFGVLPAGSDGAADMKLVPHATGTTRFQLSLTDPSLGLRPYSGEAMILFYPAS